MQLFLMAFLLIDILCLLMILLLSQELAKDLHAKEVEGGAHLHTVKCKKIWVSRRSIFILLLWKYLTLSKVRIIRWFQILFKILGSSQVLFVYISRDFIWAAYQLAKFGFDHDEHLEWFRDFPSWVLDAISILLFDCFLCGDSFLLIIIIINIGLACFM